MRSSTFGAAAHAARAAEFAAGDESVGAARLEEARGVDVLTRYPAAPDGTGRVGQLLRDMDRALRGPPRG